jgi:cell division protein YceG involved in septum cleavage
LQDELSTPMGDDATPIRFTIQSGDNASTIAYRLQEQGFITDADLFTDYVQYHEMDVQLEAGTYFLNTTMNIKQIAVRLIDSSLSQIEFTILPGQRIESCCQY